MRKGWPLCKGHSSKYHSHTTNTFWTSEKRTTSLQRTTWLPPKVSYIGSIGLNFFRMVSGTKEPCLHATPQSKIHTPDHTHSSCRTAGKLHCNHVSACQIHVFSCSQNNLQPTGHHGLLSKQKKKHQKKSRAIHIWGPLVLFLKAPRDPGPRWWNQVPFGQLGDRWGLCGRLHCIATAAVKKTNYVEGWRIPWCAVLAKHGPTVYLLEIKQSCTVYSVLWGHFWMGQLADNSKLATLQRTDSWWNWIFQPVYSYSPRSAIAN